ncbi:MAG: uroporphyrinogen decarboxylase family protein [bacterium]|nr:uroporphyrinogen decarboxylase family protein [bacterium]
MGYYLKQDIDYKKHNEEVTRLMSDYLEQRHTRVPVQVTGSIRNLLSNPVVNKTGFTFKDFFTRADAHLVCQLEYQYYMRHNILCDNIMGVPDDAWVAGMDFQNSHDQAWFGSPFRYFSDNDVPDTEELLKDDPALLYSWEDPDPFWGRGDYMKKAMEIYLNIKDKCDGGYEFHRRPVRMNTCFQAAVSDGIFSIALKLRGTVETMVDMYERPQYYRDLMEYVTRNTIARMKAHRRWANEQSPAKNVFHEEPGYFSYADDSIAMLSTDQYNEFVLPYHEKIFEAFCDPAKGCYIHLCGDATHHYKFLADTFNAKTFNTGFPVDHGKMRKILGPDIELQGGPTIMLIKDGTPESITAETKRICETGVMDGKRFMLIAANNLAPCTPVENIVALYEAGKAYGRYDA